MNIVSEMMWNGRKNILTWIPTDDLSGYLPITQVYGICVNENKEVLVCRLPNDKNWGLPGGTPENDETPMQTLERELIEEADVVTSEQKVLGVQEVKESDKTYYQVRYVCKIKELLPQTIDPDTKLMYERKFVPLAELNKHLKWGEIGEAIVAEAVKSQF